MSESENLDLPNVPRRGKRAAARSVPETAPSFDSAAFGFAKPQVDGVNTAKAAPEAELVQPAEEPAVSASTASGFGVKPTPAESPVPTSAAPATSAQAPAATPALTAENEPEPTASAHRDSAHRNVNGGAERGERGTHEPSNDHH